MAKKLNTLTVINQFIEKHGNKYYYFLVDYKNSYTKVDIICKEHGVFSQTPNKHKQGRGCPTCGGSKQLTSKMVIIQFIEKHGNIYDYSLVEYKNDNTKVDIICKEHGVFSQRPDHHKNGVGCPDCGILNGGVKPFSTSEIINQFIEKHGNRYDYSLVEYKNIKTKVDIICEKHGIFPQTPDSHKNGVGCPKCNEQHFHDRNYYKDKRTILYYLKVDDAYKIGVTTLTVKKRYSADKNVNITILKEWVFEDGAIAHDYEQMIIKYYSKYKYIGDKILKGGNTELFNENILPLFEDKIIL